MRIFGMSMPAAVPAVGFSVPFAQPRTAEATAQQRITLVNPWRAMTAAFLVRPA
jgi:hypothetical protein